MTHWVPAIAVKECPEGEVHELILEGNIVALCQIQGHFHAVEGICLHQGGPLGRGSVSDNRLTCPWHGWQYDAATGAHCQSAHACLRRWNTRVQEDHVWIDLDTPVERERGP